MSAAPARRYLALFWALAILGFSLDISTKYAVFAWLDRGQSREFISNWFSLVHQPELNRGALFGFANKEGDAGAAANWVFAAISLAAVLGISIWSFWRHSTNSLIFSVALGLILAGAMGNLYDRLVFGGVRDFLWVYYRNQAGDYPFNFPVFNIADSCLVCGAGLLLLQVFLERPQPEPAAKDASPVL